MVLSRTITAPTNLRSQVERLATTWAMSMKYGSQSARLRVFTGGMKGCGSVFMAKAILSLFDRALRDFDGHAAAAAPGPEHRAVGEAFFFDVIEDLLLLNPAVFIRAFF